MNIMLPNEIRIVAEQHLAEQEAGRELKLVIVEKFTEEIPHGWVIYCNNTTYLETKDPLWFGGFGFIIEKGTHRIIHLGGADPDSVIEEFERSHSK